ncbi:creatininase [Devosia riboflavina]|uniref:Creatininase n=1 Tax=Devosia riboflavina TaxID=46914 RepID=A0A087M3C5_9HYPH|nr:creatininase family protein [Devosia riboflavina]KFL31378.1 creatininase [Devosia riboflavina]
MKTELAQLTSQEGRQLLTDDAVILIPMGSLEDQGVHAPMGDYLAAKLIADRIAAAATAEGTPTFTAPVIPFGAEDYFGLTHGGIALRSSTLRALMDDMIGSLHRRGLKRIVLINGHGGNVPVITELALKWRRDEGMFITSLYLWQMAYGILRKELGDAEAGRASGHGADPLTSVGLYLYPEILRMDLAKGPPTNPMLKGLKIQQYGYLEYEGSPVQAPIEAAECGPDGIWGGDPKYSSPERGKMLVDRLTALGAGYIREHVSTNFAA